MKRKFSNYKFPVQDIIWMRFKGWSVSNHLEDNYTIQDDVKSVREGPIAFRGLALFVICCKKYMRLYLVLHVIHKQGAWQIFQLKQLAWQ